MDAEAAGLILARYAPPDFFLQFIRALVEADAIDTGEFVYFLEKPWKWADAFAAWDAFGRPLDHSMPGWDSFLLAVEQ